LHQCQDKTDQPRARKPASTGRLPSPPREQLAVIAPAVEIELGRGIRVRIPMTTPKELASAVIRALAAR
jgi:hypothetical protein